MELTLNKDTQSVRASINENRFFASMKHSFASSFSVLSEMMQNSRRAGATYVRFDYDESSRNLQVRDDGCGISDFAVLLKLCETGWDEATSLNENPFGMGFYSTLFACEEVEVVSMGRKLSMSVKDIENKRLLLTQHSDDPRRGTFITLRGVNKELAAIASEWRSGIHRQTPVIKSKLQSFAMGFPIRVIFNGQELERPHAQDAIQGDQTTLGFFSLAHLHDSRSAEALITRQYANHVPTALYLQGLPIQVSPEKNAVAVVHLDGREFSPVLPDRKHLYNADAKLKQVDLAIRQMVQNFLSQKRKDQTAEQYAETYWQVSIEFGVASLLNDLALFPATRLSYVGSLSYELENLDFHNGGSKFISRSELLANHLVWRDSPSDVYSDTSNGAILKYMQRNHVVAVHTNRLDTAHWIFKDTPSCFDMKATIEPHGEFANSSMGIDSYLMDVKMVESIKLSITSDADTEFKVNLEEIIEDDWVIQCDEDDANSLVCFMARDDKSPDWPICALSYFRDENETYMESWESDSIADWTALIGGLLGKSLAQTIGSGIAELNLPINEGQVGHMVLTVGRSVWDEDSQSYKSYRKLQVIDLENKDVWERFALIANQEAEFTADSLKALFVQAAKAQGNVEGPKAGVQGLALTSA